MLPICKACGGPAATDITGRGYCVYCGQPVRRSVMNTGYGLFLQLTIHWLAFAAMVVAIMGIIYDNSRWGCHLTAAVVLALASALATPVDEKSDNGSES